MKSGIYKITNKIDGKCYIGQSSNIKKRFKDHRYDLKYNKHDNPYLQNAYNKYGKDNFKFEILCEEKKKI